jgi:hypothetical protein
MVQQHKDRLFAGVLPELSQEARKAMVEGSFSRKSWGLNRLRQDNLLFQAKPASSFLPRCTRVLRLFFLYFSSRPRSVGGAGQHIRWRWLPPRLLDNQESIICTRVFSLMNQQGLESKSKRKFKTTAHSTHGRSVTPNLLERELMVDIPDAVHAGDVTNIQTVEGWLYPAVLIVLYSRTVVG